MGSDLPLFYYRYFSETSAGRLRSGRYHQVDRHPVLPKEQLMEEFKRHQNDRSTIPTALVSVTSRPLEAANRALSEYYRTHADPGTIWIVIIRVPDGERYPHSARDLAEDMRDNRAYLFTYEYLFEWKIPHAYVNHSVSLETLLNGDIEQLLPPPPPETGWFACFAEIQALLAWRILQPDLYNTGCWIMDMAYAFGLRRGIQEFASHILENCLGLYRVDHDAQLVYLTSAGGNNMLEFSDICEIECGMREQLEFHLGV